MNIEATAPRGLYKIPCQMQHDLPSAVESPELMNYKTAPAELLALRFLRFFRNTAPHGSPAGLKKFEIVSL